MNPLVSFIVPTYNRAYILGTALESILAQTYSHWEIILIDDGSTDGTKNLVERYQEKRLRYFFQENQGQVKARNTGLQKAQGEWVAYLDSDNHLFPQFLERMLFTIQGKPETLWAFPKGERYLELWKNGKLLKQIDDTKEEFKDVVKPEDIVHRRMHTDLNGFMHSRKIIDDGVSFDENMSKMEDWEFFLALAEKYPDNFLYVPETLYSYSQRFGGDGVVSNTTYKEWANLFEYIYQKHRDDRLMKGQTWYPSRVEKWRKLARDHEHGLIPSYDLYYFKEYWPKEIWK